MYQDNRARKALNSNNAISLLQILVGGFLSLIFGLAFLGGLVSMSDPEDTIGISYTIIFFIISILFAYMLIRGLKRRKLSKIYYTYTQLLKQNPACSDNQLAVVLRRPLISVRKDLDTMAKKGFLPSVYIDNRNFNQQTQNYGAQTPIVTPNIMPNNMRPVNDPKLDEYVEVICKNCGASHKVLKGSAVNCEYCGSVMKYE